MKIEATKKTAQLSKKRKRRILWQRVVSILAAITVFCTTYALILPAITMTTEAGVDLDGGYTIVTDSAGYYTFQAEEAVVVGKTVVAGETLGDLVMNTGFAYELDDGSVTFTFYASEKAEREVKIWYNTVGDRSFSLVANGTPQVVNALESDSKWATENGGFDVLTAKVNLDDGENTIVLQPSTQADGTKNPMPNFDKIEIEDPGDATIFATEAEWAASANNQTPDDGEDETTGLRIEAEDVNYQTKGDVIDQPTTNGEGDGGSNGRYAGWLGQTEDQGNIYLQFTVYVAKETTCDMEIYYNQGTDDAGARQFFVDVEGEAINDTPYSTVALEDGQDFLTPHVVEGVTLKAGANTIKIYNNGADGVNVTNSNMPNIDCIQFAADSGVSLGETYSVEAESIGGTAANDDNASGGQYAANLGNGNDNGYLEYTVYATSEGDYPLDIYYGTSGNRDLSLIVKHNNENPIYQQRITCESNANDGWNEGSFDYKTPKTVNVHLAVGVNTIRIDDSLNQNGEVRGDGEDGYDLPRIDKLELDYPAGAVVAPADAIQTKKIEAEDIDYNATLSGDGTHVSKLGVKEGDGYLEFYVYSDTAQSAVVSLAYCVRNGTENENRYAMVNVNGEYQGYTYLAPNAGDWITFTGAPANMPVSLEAGWNVIKIYNDGTDLTNGVTPTNDGAMGTVSYVTVSAANAVEVDVVPDADYADDNWYTTSFEAEDATFVGNILNRDHASNGAYVGGFDDGKGSVTFTVLNPADVEQTGFVTIYYNTYSDRDMQINVNGNVTPLTGLATCSNWADSGGEFKTVSVPVKLTPGKNTITLEHHFTQGENGAGSMPVIDKIDIQAADKVAIYGSEADYKQGLLDNSAILRFDFDKDDFVPGENGGQAHITGEGRAPSGEIIPVASAAGVTYAVDDEGNTVAKFDGTGGLFWTPNQNEDGNLIEGELSNDPAALLNPETGESTFSVWFKPDEAKSNELFTYGGADGIKHKYALQVLSRRTGVEIFYRDADGNASTQNNKRMVTVTLAANEWHLFNVVQNADGTVDLYVDGVDLQVEGLNPGEAHKLIDFITNADSSYYLGVSPSTSAHPEEYFKGYMDEFVLYDRVLSAEEIQALYEQRHQIKIVESDPVVGATVKLFDYDEFVNELDMATPTNFYDDILKANEVESVTIYNNPGNSLNGWTTTYDNQEATGAPTFTVTDPVIDPATGTNILFHQSIQDIYTAPTDGKPYPKRPGFWESIMGFRFFHQERAKMNPNVTGVDGSGPFLDFVTTNSRGYGLGAIAGGDLMKSELVDGYPAFKERTFTFIDDTGATYNADPSQIDQSKRQEIKYTWSGYSMQPFFNENYDTRVETESGAETIAQDGQTYANEFYVATMQNGGGLFQLKSDGYYEYDSAKNAAWYDYENNKFELYDHAVRPLYEQGEWGVNNEIYGNFYPFNRVLSDGTKNYVTCDVTEGSGSAYQTEDTEHLIEADTIARLSQTEATDNWFGMSVEFDFYMPKGGQVENPSNGELENMVFDFYGDDDVYVFIDNQLVLNIGGIHGAVGGSINFATGEVKDGTGTKSLKQLFNLSGVTFDGYTMHKLKFFYMERGGNISYCRLRFNMPIIQPNTLAVTKELTPDSGIYDNGKTVDFKFRVVQPDGDTDSSNDVPYFPKGHKFNIRENSVVTENAGTVQEGGYFYLRAGQQAEFPDIDPGAEFIVQEILPTTYIDPATGQYVAIMYNGVSSSTDGEGFTKLEPIESEPLGDETIYSTPIITTADSESRFIAFQNEVNMENLNALEVSKDFAADMTAEEIEQYKDREFQMHVEIGGKLVPVDTEYTLYSKANPGGTEQTVKTEGIIPLKAGEWAVIDKLLAGTPFVVKEVDMDGFNSMYNMGIHYQLVENAETVDVYYAQHAEEDPTPIGSVESTDPDTGTHTVDLFGTSYIHVENSTYAFNAEIPIEKQITEPDGSTDFFHFAVEEVNADGTSLETPTHLSGAVINTNANGSGTASVYIGYKSDVVSGTYYYKITEDANFSGTIGDYYFDDTVYYVAITVDQQKGTATVTKVCKDSLDNEVSFTGDDLKLTFTNPRTVELKINKSVIGAATTQATQAFDFRVKFTKTIDAMLDLDSTDAADLYTIGCTHGGTHEEITVQFTSGDDFAPATDTTYDGAIFQLAHGDTVTFRVPVGVEAVVTEVNPDGYSVEYVVDGGTANFGSQTSPIQARATTVVNFINTEYYELPETGGMGVHGYIMSGMALLSAAGWLLYRKLRNRGEGVASR